MRLDRFINARFVLVGLILAGAAGCTELKDELPPAVSPRSQVHPDGWSDSSSAAFHGKILKAQEYDAQACQQCHGRDFKGGSSRVSCLSCHASFPHTDTWIDFTSDRSHGTYLKEKSYDGAECRACHGPAYDGGTSGVSCASCHVSFPHGATWSVVSSAEFHGKYLKAKDYSAAECQTCHGTSFDGGTSGVACSRCHSSYPHETGWTSGSSPAFHGDYLAAVSYNETECQSCHGSDFTGGTSDVSCLTCHARYPHPAGWSGSGSSAHAGFIRAAAYDFRDCSSCHGSDYGTPKAGVSCLTCHTQAGGPEACNTCHGSAVNPAPPKDLSDNTATTFRTVGSHQSHVVAGALADGVPCRTCHQAPTEVYETGHVDTGSPAEVMFVDSLTYTITNEPGTADYDSFLPLTTPSPSFNSVTLRCENTYCHGVFKNGNPSNAPVWTSVGQGEAACGTCHGDVTRSTLAERARPKTAAEGGSHTTSTTCGNCHSAVVDANLNFVDKSKHINGKLNLFSLERNF